MLLNNIFPEDGFVKFTTDLSVVVFPAPFLPKSAKQPGFFKSKVDVVVSDMAVNTTGIKDIDAIYTGELAMEAMNFSKEMLVKEGRFVSKIFLGSSFNEIVALGKKLFKEVKVFKPKSSRKESKESFIICKILR